MNIITEETKKEDLEKEYSSYPSVLNGERLIDRPWMWNRLGPLFYECKYGSKVLDIGTNTGEFLELLVKERGCEGYGIDISEVCVKQAQDKGLNVQLGSGDKIPFPEETFDYVFLNEVLVHVFSPKDVLKEIKRVLKKDGVLLGSSPHKNLQMKVWEEKFSHHNYFDTQEMADLLDSVFEKVYIRTLNGAQFAFTMAHSVVGDEEAEILFKCGGSETKNFEEALEDKKILRVWMGFTQPPADVYYRMSGYADKMREKGAEIAYEAYSQTDLSQTGDWQGKIKFKHIQNQFDAILRAADFSIWQVTQNMDCLAFFRCIKDLYKKPFVTEIDDWLFDIPSSNLASGPYRPNSDYEWTAYKQIEMSDYVIVSTKFLRDGLSELFPGKQIFIVKNSIDFKNWDGVEPFETIPKKKEGFIRLGYTGCANHDGDVELIKKPLLALLEKYENLEIVFPLRFDSYNDVNHPRFLFVNKWLPLTKYPGEIKGWDLDIGLAPLRDNNLNRAKSNLRWLEYSALKIPSVVSKVQPFQESVVNGHTGYLCNSKKEWFERLCSLIENETERKRIGENAYHEVKRNFNMDTVAEGYRDLLEHIKKEALK